MRPFSVVYRKVGKDRKGPWQGERSPGKEGRRIGLDRVQSNLHLRVSSCTFVPPSTVHDLTSFVCPTPLPTLSRPPYTRPRGSFGGITIPLSTGDTFLGGPSHLHSCLRGSTPVPEPRVVGRRAIWTQVTRTSTLIDLKDLARYPRLTCTDTPKPFPESKSHHFLSLFSSVDRGAVLGLPPF